MNEGVVEVFSAPDVVEVLLASAGADIVEVSSGSAEVVEVGNANFTGVSTGETMASNGWGSAVGVVAGETATLTELLSSPEGYRIKGFTANGTGDGYFFVQINSMTILSGRIRSTAPVYLITLPNGVLVTPASRVSLKVTNESGSTADFEATLLGA
jgi:hypothetical protein